MSPELEKKYGTATTRNRKTRISSTTSISPHEELLNHKLEIGKITKTEYETLRNSRKKWHAENKKKSIRTKKRSPQTTKKRSPKTTGLLISNNLPYPDTFNKPGFDSAKGDVESEIATIPIICLKKPVNKEWHSKDKVLKGYKLQDKLSKKHDFVCKIYQLIYKNGYFYSWQEAGVSLKKYIIDNPAEEQAKLAEASKIIETLYNTYQFVYNDKSVDNFIIINNKVKIIDFELIVYKKLKPDNRNALKVIFTAEDGKRSTPKNSRPLQRTSTPPMRRTSTLPMRRTSTLPMRRTSTPPLLKTP